MRLEGSENINAEGTSQSIERYTTGTRKTAGVIARDRCRTRIYCATVGDAMPQRAKLEQYCSHLEQNMEHSDRFDLP